jgi:hypothetical protein
MILTPLHFLHHHRAVRRLGAGVLLMGLSIFRTLLVE